jgi:hypothetical protein
METGESLRSICRDDAFPHVGQVIKWLAKNTNMEFRLQYARGWTPERRLQQSAMETVG